MKKLFSPCLAAVLCLATLGSSVPTRAQDAAKTIQPQQNSGAALTERDVLEMWRAGLSPEVIVAKIKSSEKRFDTSPAKLQELKAAGVPDAILLAMFAPPTVAPIIVARATTETVLVQIPEGTPIEIESMYEVRSSDVKKDAALSFRVVSPVVINGVTVIERGALANGRVVKAKGARRWGRSGELVWTVQDVTAADGQTVLLTPTDNNRRGEGKRGEVATKTIITGALLIPLFPIAPLALMNGFKKGKDAVLPAGTRYRVFTQTGASLRIVQTVGK